MYYIHVYMSIQYMQYASRNLFSPPQSEGGKEPCVLYRENILSQIPPGERGGGGGGGLGGGRGVVARGDN